MHGEVAILLLIIAFGALISPPLGRKLGVPVAVVEIVFGVLVAAVGGANAVSAPFIRFLADLGFALFLFLAGMELDARELRRSGPRAVIGPFVSALCATGLALAGAWKLGLSPWIALALSATSVPLLIAVLRELGLGRSARGKAMITAAAIGEIVSVGLVAIGEIASSSEDAAAATGGLVRLVGLLALVVVGTRLLGVMRWWFPERARALMDSEDAAESGVRAGFLLTLAMIAVASVAGIEPLLGAFFGGLMVSFAVDDTHAMEHKFGAMAYGFFVPVFFVDVGMRLDLGGADFLERLPEIGAMVACMLLVKLVTSLPLMAFGVTWRWAVARALLFAAPLTLVIAIADLAGRLGAIDEHVVGSLIAAGMLASLLFPSIARRLLPSGT